MFTRELINNRKPYPESRPFKPGFSYFDLALMICNDAITDGQSQARTFAHLLGGEKGIENLLAHM